MRQCGGCTKCCTLLPVNEGVLVEPDAVSRALGGTQSFHTESFVKPANTRCKFQRHGKGCTVHGTALMPTSCSVWRCRWLDGEDVGPRPDRSHLVVDPMPDLIQTINHETGEVHETGVICVWCDPHHRDAHRDPDFRRWLERQQMPALIRYSPSEAFVLAPPHLTGPGEGWLEIQAPCRPGPQNTVDRITRALGGNLTYNEDATVATVRVGNREFEVAITGPTK
jgi:hypothetical protein